MDDNDNALAWATRVVDVALASWEQAGITIFSGTWSHFTRDSLILELVAQREAGHPMPVDAPMTTFLSGATERRIVLECLRRTIGAL